MMMDNASDGAFFGILLALAQSWAGLSIWTNTIIS